MWCSGSGSDSDNDSVVEWSGVEWNGGEGRGAEWSAVQCSAMQCTFLCDSVCSAMQCSVAAAAAGCTRGLSLHPTSPGSPGEEVLQPIGHVACGFSRP